MTTVADCMAVLDALYPAANAAEWDAVGLVVGDPGVDVRRVHVAVDPTEEVAVEAVATGAELLLTHHPLFLRGVHAVPATTPGGRVVATLVRGGCALMTAHTNADVARPGVSDALLAVLGVPGPGEPLQLLASGGEARLGLGRVGDLSRPETLRAFLARAAACLPATPAGVRAGGDPERLLRRVAVCGGSGGDLADAARAAGADVFVTADLRHHVALDALAAGGLALVDVTHWASERPWCDDVAQRLGAALPAVTVSVSTRVTDPWSLHEPTAPGGPSS